ncbi:hypothetical protein [Vagococcus fluvialis]|uniref:hypothetical protein n=1 Tax=Vagococcus fluvialis TaxID=2738 RepID=UPI0037A1DFBF
MKRIIKKRTVVVCLLPIFVLLGSQMLQDTNAAFYQKQQQAYNGQEGNLQVKLVDNSTITSSLPISGVQDRVIEVMNEGEVNQFVRVLVHPTFKDENGIQQVVSLEDMTGGLNSIDWQPGEDGYYYYQKKLKAGNKTPALFQQVKGSKEGTLTFHLKVEAVSAQGSQFVDAWWQGKSPTTPNLASIHDTLKGVIE